jgi:hypothetical protein
VHRRAIPMAGRTRGQAHAARGGQELPPDPG